MIILKYLQFSTLKLVKFSIVSFVSHKRGIHLFFYIIHSFIRKLQQANFIYLQRANKILE